jgi:hypothetical protein
MESVYMDNFESIKAKLKKLLALAEGGCEGEARSARALLECLCSKYGISIDNLFDADKKDWYTFDVGINSLYKKLFVQCYCCLMNVDKLSYKRVSKSRMSVELTAYEYAELSAMYSWHKSNIKKDIDKIMNTLFISYCSKHDITNHTKRADDPQKSITYEEFHRLKSIIEMQDYLSDNYYHKLLSKTK